MQPRLPLTIQCETSFQGLTPGGSARIEIEFPGNWIKRALVHAKGHTTRTLHETAIKDVIGEGFSLHIVRDTLSGYVWEISIPRSDNH